MNRPLSLMILASALGLFGCPSSTTNDTSDGASGPGGATVNDGDDGTSGGSDTGGGDDTSGGTDTDDGVSISGRVNAPDSAKAAAVLQGADTTGFQVVVQSQSTMETYSAQTDADGNFTIDMPEEERDGLVIVTLIGPDSHAVGPLVFGQDGQQGWTGLQVGGNADLGTIDASADHSAPLMPGGDADLGDATVANDVVARLDASGVPVGVPNVGKGGDALGDASSDPQQLLDRDRDGLIDAFDADDDGDGTVDDFDGDATINPAQSDGLVLNFFMNLKLDDIAAEDFFTGNNAGISEKLKYSTVITFEVRAEPSFAGTITGARIVGPPAPAPPYLPLCTINGTSTLWSDDGYELQPEGGANHFQQWVVPNEFINAGDNFTVEVDFGDGSTRTYTRMINYVFKSIPKLVHYGAPGDPQDYAGALIQFDPSQDLVLEWNPPVDETEGLLTDLDYFLEVFYYDAGGQQLNGQIDFAATWPTPPAGFGEQGTTTLSAPASTLSLSAENTFTVTMPHEIFVSEVQTATGAVAVARYKVDIAAQNDGSNAALMVQLEPQ